MRYGTAKPHQLVERAAAFGQPALALTDRDGLYGAVKFVRACMEHDVAPILGVDLAIGPEQPERHRPVRTPVRGGALVDPRLPRVTVLARGSGTGLAPGEGWAALCRLVTATHLRGERGNPVTTASLVAEHARPVPDPEPDPGSTPAAQPARRRPVRRTRGTAYVHSGGGSPSRLVVLLGPDSDVGREVLAKRRDRARAALERWVALLPRGAVVVEVVCHGGPEHQPGSLGQAGRMLALAREVGVPSVITAAVRHADPQDAAIVDVLDAARRLVALDARHLDRVTTAGHLSPTPLMHALALDVVQVSGPGLVGGGSLAREQARELLARTTALAAECVQDPRADLGIGSVHLPEPGILGIRPGTNPHRVLARRCRESIPTRYPGRTESELGARQRPARGRARRHRDARLRDVLPHRRPGLRPHPRDGGAGRRPRLGAGSPRQLPPRHLRRRPDAARPAHGALLLTAARELPDIDIDVESARRTEIYERILDHFGGDRVTCVSMMDTYRVRHAIRDAGAALGLPPPEVDAMAKAFPHIAARNVRNALAELPELRASGLDVPRLQLMFDIVERLDGLPRHIALHPCGVVLSDSVLLDRTPVEASWLGFPMSQFDKDDVEEMGLLKLDVLGIRMQSAMAHAIDEVERVDGATSTSTTSRRCPSTTSRPSSSSARRKTLGCFQIESPGQRELIGKFGPAHLRRPHHRHLALPARPGQERHDHPVPQRPAGLEGPLLPAPVARPRARGDRGRRRLPRAGAHDRRRDDRGDPRPGRRGAPRARHTRRARSGSRRGGDPRPAARGYAPEVADKIWEVLKAFASFGFCKAHAAAFALPTYQSAWLKTHHPAAFLAGVLTHDPGMYPKRLILDDARTFGIAILGLDVNVSDRRLPLRDAPTTAARPSAALALPTALPSGSLADVHGISEAEVAQIVAGQPYSSLSDFWQRAHVSRPSPRGSCSPGASTPSTSTSGRRAESSGAGVPQRPRPRGRVTRRDLLLHVAELDRWSARSAGRAGTGLGRGRRVAAVTGAGHSVSADRRHPGPRRRASPRPPPGRRARRHPAHARPRRRATALRDERAARDDRSRAGPGRARGARPRRERPRRRLLRSAARRARRDPGARPALRPQRPRGARRRGQGRHPDPADPHRPPRRLPHPRRRAPARPTSPSSRTSRDRMPPPSSTRGCCSAAGSCDAPARAASRSGPPARGSSRPCRTRGPPGGITAVRDALDAADRAAWERATALAGPDGGAGRGG